jgi:hypothetical protein
MHVLLDEQLPRHLAREIGGHDVSTIQSKHVKSLGAACKIPF